MEKIPNLHEISEERKNLKEIINDPEEPEIIKNSAQETLKESKDENKESLRGLIERLGGLSNAKIEVKEGFKKDKERSEKSAWIDEESISSEMGPKFKELGALESKKADLRDFEMQRLRASQSNPNVRKSNERLLKTIQTDKVEVQKGIDEIEKKSSRVYRSAELVNYKKGLHEEGHIAATPSVLENLDKIGRRMITGKPMFLHGPTGTGKTSLGRFAAKHFTGKDAEMVYCNPQTRISTIWGKTGIKPVENNINGAIETVDILGSLSRAIKEGKVIIFDEFTALPEELMVSTKGIFGYKAGDLVPIDGNGKIQMAPGFQMIFTANLKSEKNPERKEMPPEMKREFEQNNLEVAYTPKEESYDIMLARLMNPDGSVDMSWYDLNTTLPKLCEAMEEIQVAYTDKEREEIAKQTGTMNASGERQGLKKFVMTQGTVEAIFEDWKVEKQIESKPKSFSEFLDERLAVGVTFKEYSEADRVLVAKILASKGFLRTQTAEDLSLPKDVFDFDAAKKQRGDEKALESLKKDSSKEVHVTMKELADLDPFGLRRKSVVESAEQFLNPEKGGDDFSKGMEEKMKRILGRKEEGGEVDNPVISAEYVYNNPQTGKEERRENIEIDIEKTLIKYIDLFEETGLQVPEDFEDSVREIWSRNSDEIQKAMEEKGFDDMIIAPGNIPLDDLKEKMKMQNGYYTSGNFDNGGGFAGAKSIGVDKVRIILVHKAQNIKDRPELKSTLGIKAENTDMDTSLSLEDYLYFQRAYFKETGKHLDEGDSFTWLPRTKSGSRVVASRWDSVDGRLRVNALDADYSNSNLGCRASRYFI